MAQEGKKPNFRPIKFVPTSSETPSEPLFPAAPPIPHPVPIEPPTVHLVEPPVSIEVPVPAELSVSMDEGICPNPQYAAPLYLDGVNYSEDYMVGPEFQNPNGQSHEISGDGHGYYSPFNRNGRPMRYYEARPYPPPQHPQHLRGGGLGWKRSMVSDGNDIENKRPRKADGATASRLLNEKHPGLVYKFSDQIGPSHAPSFEVTVSFPPTGKEYMGAGRSKKLAKNNVAESILADLGIPIPEPYVTEKMLRTQESTQPVQEVPHTQPEPESQHQEVAEMHPDLLNPFQHFPFTPEYDPPPPVDFSSDDLPGIVPGQPLAVPSEGYIDPKMLKRLVNVNVYVNACSALNSLLGPLNEIRYEFVSEGGLAHEKFFEIKLTFKDQRFIDTQTDVPIKEFLGIGGSKKKAKADAARQGLISVLGITYFEMLNRFGKMTSTPSGPVGQEPSPTRPRAKPRRSPRKSNSAAQDPEALEYIVFADHVASLINEKFASLTGENEVHNTQKVLAGVVMTRGDPLLKNSTVVAVTTGTKCIEGDFMSDKGLALNDCHAEILATRCVRDYIYSQIDLLNTLDNPMAEVKPDIDSLIFENFGVDGQGVTKYKLKDDVKFHLYISTSPCGDARIFSPNGIGSPVAPPPPGDESVDPNEDSHPRRINRGILRAKIEAGEGTIPVANLSTGSGVQTWDAILQGNALHTMSCSDKVARWNVLGFQGALLSIFMGPVYYSTVTLGSLHHPVHFRRALITRLESLEGSIETPYTLNKPRLLMVSRDGKRRVKKSPGHAIAWQSDWSAYEAISASKGRCEPGGVASRLTKRMAFVRFLKLFKNKSGARDNYADLSYECAKLLAEDFQINKAKFLAHVTEAGLGNWISKPLEQDAFFLD